jgi:translation initiation factor IF-2
MADDQGQNRPNRPIRPRQAPGSRRKRRVVIDSQANRPRPDSRQARDRSDRQPKQPREVVLPTGPVTVESGVTVKELSHALGIPVAQIIKIMMGLGEMVTITQSLSDDAVRLLLKAAQTGRKADVKQAIREWEARQRQQVDA